MTLRLPDDLPALRALATEVGPALTMVYHEEPLEPPWEGPELPVVRIDLSPHSHSVEFFTMPNASEASLEGALAFAEVLAQLERYSKDGGVHELFWVSGVHPLAAETPSQDSDYAVRLALPLAALAHATDPSRVAFVARRTA